MSAPAAGTLYSTTGRQCAAVQTLVNCHCQLEKSPGRGSRTSEVRRAVSEPAAVKCPSAGDDKHAQQRLTHRMGIFYRASLYILARYMLSSCVCVSVCLSVCLYAYSLSQVAVLIFHHTARRAVPLLCIHYR